MAAQRMTPPLTNQPCGVSEEQLWLVVKRRKDVIGGCKVAVGGGNSEPPTYKITNWRHNNPPRCDLGAVVTVQPCPSTPMSAIAFEHISPSHYIVGQHCESDVTFCQKINENVKCMKKWMYVYRTGQWPLWGETEWKATVECRLYIVVQKLSSKIVSLQKPQALKQ